MSIRFCIVTNLLILLINRSVCCFVTCHKCITHPNRDFQFIRKNSKLFRNIVNHRKKFKNCILLKLWIFSALGLRFCRLKTDFAQEQGIRQSAPPVAATTKRPRFSPTRSRLIPTPISSQSSEAEEESSFTREGDTLIVTPSRTVSEEEQAEQQTNLRSTLIDRLRNRPKAPAVSNGGTQNDACKGTLP